MVKNRLVYTMVELLIPLQKSCIWLFVKLNWILRLIEKHLLRRKRLHFEQNSRILVKYQIKRKSFLQKIINLYRGYKPNHEMKRNTRHKLVTLRFELSLVLWKWRTKSKFILMLLLKSPFKVGNEGTKYSFEGKCLLLLYLPELRIEVWEEHEIGLHLNFGISLNSLSLDYIIESCIISVQLNWMESNTRNSAELWLQLFCSKAYT